MANRQSAAISSNNRAPHTHERISHAVQNYLLSLYIVESIVLYNFEYHDEILKRKINDYVRRKLLGVLIWKVKFKQEQTIIISM